MIKATSNGSIKKHYVFTTTMIIQPTIYLNQKKQHNENHEIYGKLNLDN